MVEFTNWSFSQTKLLVFQNEVIQVTVCSKNDSERIHNTHFQDNIKKMICLVLYELTRTQNPFNTHSFIDYKNGIAISTNIKKWSIRNKYKFLISNKEVIACPYKLTCIFDFLDSKEPK